MEDCRGAVTDICKKWYANFLKTGQEGPDWEEVANRRPAWKEGSWQPESGQEELGFRRLYRMTLHEEFFVKMCRHHKVSKIYVNAESLWNPIPCYSVSLLPKMYYCNFVCFVLHTDFRSGQPGARP